MYLEKVKNFGAANELKIETGELKITGAVTDNCHAELVSASDQYGANVNFQTEKTLKAEKADGIYAGKREPKSRQRSEVMTGASAKRFQERVQGDNEWDAKGNEKSEINVKEHPNIFNSQLSIFNSKKRYGCKLSEDTEIVSEDINLSPLAGSRIASADVNLSPLRGKYPPEAGERGLMKRGFTLAEVLITLVVIGVVAAITIPVLHSNTQGKEWNAAKQKARAGMGEAFKLASVNNDLPDISAKEYVKTVLPKYLKLAKTCDTAQECGFPNKIKTVDGNEVDITGEWKWSSYARAGSNISVWNGTMPASGSWQTRAVNPSEDTEAAFFQTVDGFSVSMLYNPNCAADLFDKPAGDFSYYDDGRAWAADQIAGQYSYDVTCFNAVYDMNGSKGPNTVGKDIGFAGSFYSGIQAHSAAVLPVKNDTSRTDWNTASQRCKNLSPAGDYDLPAIDELSLIFLNDKLTVSSSGSGLEAYFWSRSAVGGKPFHFRQMCFDTGSRSFDPGTAHVSVRCVRADKLM